MQSLESVFVFKVAAVSPGWSLSGQLEVVWLCSLEKKRICE